MWVKAALTTGCHSVKSMLGMLATNGLYLSLANVKPQANSIEPHSSAH